MDITTLHKPTLRETLGIKIAKNAASDNARQGEVCLFVKKMI